MSRKRTSLINLSLISISLIIFTGCNKSSSQVLPNHLSSTIYENKSCEFLERELKHIEIQVDSHSRNVDISKKQQDMKLALGWIFWPSYLVIDNNDFEAKQLAEVKGEYEAILLTMDKKDCR